MNPPSVALRDLRVSNPLLPLGDETPALDPLTCEQIGIQPGTSFGQFERHELEPANPRPARNPPEQHGAGHGGGESE